MKKVFTVSFVSLFTLFSGFSMDFSVDMNPGIVFPSGKCAEIMKGPAFGADVGFNLHFLDLITVGPEIGVDYIIKEGEPSSIVDIAPGIKAVHICIHGDALVLDLMPQPEFTLQAMIILEKKCIRKRL